jgi:hypothetical protein
MEEGIVAMNKNQRRTYQLAIEVTRNKLSIQEFALQIGKSYRHARRIIQRVRSKDALGILHGNVGRTPCNKTPEANEQEVLRLLRTRYYDFNLTHFKEDCLKCLNDCYSDNQEKKLCFDECNERCDGIPQDKCEAMRKDCSAGATSDWKTCRQGCDKGDKECLQGCATDLSDAQKNCNANKRQCICEAHPENCSPPVQNTGTVQKAF